ncbi:MAG: EAL domain-containing protein, partial [Pseudomonadota bacterium]
DLAKFTRALIRLADNLGISILAEGIENEEERAWLQAEGCQVIQGYLIGKPMAADALFDWAKARGDVQADTVAHQAPRSG